MVVAGACASGNARHSRKGPRLVAVRRQRLWARRRITLTRDRAPPAAPTRAATVDGPGIVSVALVFGPLHPGPYSVARARPSTRSRDRQQITALPSAGATTFRFGRDWRSAGAVSPLAPRGCWEATTTALRVALFASLSLSSAAAWASGPPAAQQHGAARRLCRARLRLSGGGERHAGTRAMAASLAGASRADAWLQARGVEFSIIEQEQATGKCRDSAASRGVSLRQIIKYVGGC